MKANKHGQRRREERRSEAARADAAIFLVERRGEFVLPLPGEVTASGEWICVCLAAHRGGRACSKGRS